MYQQSNLSTRIAQSFDPQFFNLILFPTEQCNFRCTYCYEDFKLKTMKSELVESIKLLITDRAKELNYLEISWFGGEPLLAKSVIYEISSHITSLVEKFPHLVYQASMTTNAYFLDVETFNQLVQFGVKTYQISLDGDRELHNQTRLRADKAGTFDTIWQNLLNIRSTEHDATIMLRIHYSPESWEQLFPLIDKINQEFGHDARFYVFFKAIKRLGGLNDAQIPTFDSQSEARVKALLESKLSYKRMVAGIGSDNTPICYASKPNSLAIRSDGSIAKCTVGLNDPRNQIGHLNLDGTIHINQDLLRPWLKGFETGDLDALKCPYSKMKRPVVHSDNI